MRQGTTPAGGDRPLPIRLLVVDIDGCLVGIEHAPYDLDRLARVAALNRSSRRDRTVPPLTILSGRPHPYVDALMQVLDVRLPAVFENGAGLAFRHPYGARFRSEAERGSSDLARLRELLAGRDEVFLQPGKSASLTAFPAGPEVAAEAVEQLVRDLVDAHRLALHVDPARECVNVLVPGVDKGLGLEWLADTAGVATEHVAGIGDSPGDIVWLERCGVSCAPGNAGTEVKERVDVVSELPDISALLELYESMVERNRAAGAAAPARSHDPLGSEEAS